MPHIEIRCYPRVLSNIQQEALAQALCDVLKTHLGASDASLSVGLKMIAPEDWKSEVWDTQIEPEMETLLKQPGYRL